MARTRGTEAEKYVVMASTHPGLPPKHEWRPRLYPQHIASSCRGAQLPIRRCCVPESELRRLPKPMKGDAKVP